MQQEKQDLATHTRTAKAQQHTYRNQHNQQRAQRLLLRQLLPSLLLLPSLPPLLLLLCVCVYM